MGSMYSLKTAADMNSIKSTLSSQKVIAALPAGKAAAGLEGILPVLCAESKVNHDG